MLTWIMTTSLFVKGDSSIKSRNVLVLIASMCKDDMSYTFPCIASSEIREDHEVSRVFRKVMKGVEFGYER
jgi:hypothetical protein